MPTPPNYPALMSNIAGVAVLDLARRFGTPAFVYDADMIRRRIADLRIRLRALRSKSLLQPGDSGFDPPAGRAGRLRQRQRNPPGVGCGV